MPALCANFNCTWFTTAWSKAVRSRYFPTLPNVLSVLAINPQLCDIPVSIPMTNLSSLYSTTCSASPSMSHPELLSPRMINTPHDNKHVSNKVQQNSTATVFQTFVNTSASQYPNLEQVVHEQDPQCIVMRRRVQPAQKRPRIRIKREDSQRLIRNVLGCTCVPKAVGWAEGELRRIFRAVYAMLWEARTLLKNAGVRIKIDFAGSPIIRQKILLLRVLEAFPQQDMQLKTMDKLVRRCRQTEIVVAAVLSLAQEIHQCDMLEAVKGLIEQLGHKVATLHLDAERLTALVPDLARHLAGLAPEYNSESLESWTRLQQFLSVGGEC